MSLDEIIDLINPLPPHSRAILKTYVTEISVPKGLILLEADKTEKSIYFIKKGIVRAYSNQESNEVTFWFGKEGEAVISMRSYVENQKGYENIQLLEDCDLYQLKSDKLKELFLTDIHVANWGRRFAEKEMVKTEERLISRQFKTAAERYQELLKTNPDLLQRVQLGHIASYLGITQVSLSRIRAEVK
ncbi:MAG: Crp/Fnr family transcriptional regulator [Pedobacter sp.]|nr:MAG: Crp/Fnr family transcriptional regulator [Pedobacter sp.]